MLHQSHSAISRPAFLVVIPYNVLIVWIWVFSQVSLYQLSRLLLTESEYDVKLVYISEVKPYRVSYLSLHIFETHEFIWS